MPEGAEGGRPAETPGDGPDATTLFLAELSHEIRNPLNVVLGLCHLATCTPPLSPQHRHGLPWCHRLHTDRGTWETALAPAHSAFTVCPDCLRDLLA
jgi:hypothetical protein